jgi:hypothetical protein
MCRPGRPTRGGGHMRLGSVGQPAAEAANAQARPTGARWRQLVCGFSQRQRAGGRGSTCGGSADRPDAAAATLCRVSQRQQERAATPGFASDMCASCPNPLAGWHRRPRARPIALTRFPRQLRPVDWSRARSECRHVRALAHPCPPAPAQPPRAGHVALRRQATERGPSARFLPALRAMRREMGPTHPDRRGPRPEARPASDRASATTPCLWLDARPPLNQ